MANSVADKRYFNFTGGLNTEAGPLTYPPNTWQDGDNVVPHIDGSLHKRFAVNYENDYTLSPTGDSATTEQTAAFVSEEWNSVGGNGSRNFIVVQRGAALVFYVNSGTSISSTNKSFSLDLTLYKAPGNPNAAGLAPISCVSCNGRLLVTSADTDPILVTYDEDTDTISHSAVTVTIRDLYGVTDNLSVNERPAGLSDAHHYNLLNQGWDDTKINNYASNAGLYPSNAQVWTAAKDNSDDFDWALLDKQDFGTSPAPKGRFVLSLFRRNRTYVSSVPNIPSEDESYRPTTCAFFAGRAWYAGVRSSDISTWVLFTQVASTSDKFGKCYQDADPTSEVVSDLVATDGGVIPIQDVGSVVKLQPLDNTLLVMADNGIWQISGGLDSVFSASSYEVRKLSSAGCISAKSVVETESGILYWSHDGIYLLARNDAGALQVNSVSNTTVQSFYTAIPPTGRAYASGAYLREEKTVTWVFNSDPLQDGITRRFKKNRMLSLDLRLKAFYPHTVSSITTLSPYMVDVFVTKPRTTVASLSDVVVGSDTVVVGSDTVEVNGNSAVLRNTELRFLTCAPQSASSFKWTLARFEDGSNDDARWRDWYAADTTGASFSAFVLPGYDLGADQGGAKNMQAVYAVVFLNRTETGVDSDGNAINPSSCMMQARWDWADSAAAGKWSASREVYRHRRAWMPSVPSATFDDGYPVVVTKNKVRGRGRALQLRFAADPDKAMELVGWQVAYLGNTNI